MSRRRLKENEMPETRDELDAIVRHIAGNLFSERRNHMAEDWGGFNLEGKVKFDGDRVMVSQNGRWWDLAQFVAQNIQEGQTIRFMAIQVVER